MTGRLRPRRARARVPFLRRRSTLWLIAAVATLTLGIVLGALASGDGEREDAAPSATLARTIASTATAAVPSTPTSPPAVALPDLRPDAARLQPAVVLEVIDGDTIDVRLNGREERVRYYGVDTPERGDRCFDEARARNAALAGDRVLLLPDARERDRFGRLLRYVFTEEGESVDARLIAEGLGLAWREDGAYRDALVALEGEARVHDVGCLWGE